MNVNAAVVNDIPCSMIFGQPFLIMNQLIYDCANASLRTRRGPVQLISSKQRVPTAATTTVINDSSPSDQTADLNDILNLKDSMLNPQQKLKLRQLMHRYRKLWAGEHPGWVRHAEHRIRVTTEHPIRDNPRYHTVEQNEEIQRQVEDMLAHGILRPSNSPHAAEIVMAKKKDSDGKFTGWRLCLDYRLLNTFTVPDAYPIPRITDLTRAVRGSHYFVALDLRWGYWNIPMEKSSITYTAFRCAMGLFEFLKMPFGLTNAPATFQRLADFLFGDYRHRGVLAYLDDILVHSPTFEGCLANLRIVLDRLQAEGLIVNIGKSNFFPQELKYLGHVIKNGTMMPNAAKVAPLLKYKKPQTAYDVRRLMGQLGYYQPYIANFSGIMFPITELLKRCPNKKNLNKKHPIEWSVECDAAAQSAIAALQKAVVAIPLETDEFRLETDASGSFVAAVLSCKRNDGTWMPVEFVSKKLSETERRWPVRDQEAYAIIYGLKKFDTYLRGRAFEVHTDHKSLRWMLGAKDGRVARWASRLSEYQLTIVHKSGDTIEHVDYLTRFLDLDDDFDVEPHMSYSTAQPHVNIIRATSATLPSIEDIIAEQKRSDFPTIKGIYIKDGVVFFHNAIWVPPKLRSTIIGACHIVLPFHHNGTKSTEKTIRRVFNWPRLHRDVVDYRRACLGCTRTRQGIDRFQGLFKTHPVDGPFSTVYVDYWSCTYAGHEYSVLTMIDSLTKWAECIPIISKETEPVVSAFISYWVCRFGVPETIVNDNDKTLTGHVVRGLHSFMGTKRIVITPYHPEGNAVIESFHKHLNQGLASLEVPNRPVVPFFEALQLVLYSYRSRVHSTTKETPAFLTYGMDLRSPAGNDWRFAPSTPMSDRIKFLNEMRLDIQWRAFEERLHENDKRNESRKDRKFQLHELVLVRATPQDKLRFSYQPEAHGRKLAPRWSLPYRVIKVSHNRKSATVRSLLTKEDRDVQIQDVRFVNRPSSAVQNEEWRQNVVREAHSLFEPDVRQSALHRFFEYLDYPQAIVDDASVLPRKKRRR